MTKAFIEVAWDETESKWYVLRSEIAGISAEADTYELLLERASKAAAQQAVLSSAAEFGETLELRFITELTVKAG